MTEGQGPGNWNCDRNLLLWKWGGAHGGARGTGTNGTRALCGVCVALVTHHQTQRLGTAGSHALTAQQAGGPTSGWRFLWTLSRRSAGSLSPAFRWFWARRHPRLCLPFTRPSLLSSVRWPKGLAVGRSAPEVRTSVHFAQTLFPGSFTGSGVRTWPDLFGGHRETHHRPPLPSRSGGVGKTGTPIIRPRHVVPCAVGREGAKGTDGDREGSNSQGRPSGLAWRDKLETGSARPLAPRGQSKGL